jgi:sec-independent protein translocase protein TatC
MQITLASTTANADMMTFFDHLLELRSRVLISLLAVTFGAVIAHYYHESIIAFFLRPIHGQKLIFLSPLEPLFFIFKIDLFVGFILALPVLNWCVLSFVRPAMKQSSWFLFSTLYCATAVLVLGGLAYAYFVMVPISLAFLLSINVVGTETMITANSYLGFLLIQSLIIAGLFQLPLFILAGSYIRAFEIATLSSKRRYIYVAGLIALAVITPTTDLFNLAIVAIPAFFLFEGSLVVARIIESLRRKRDTPSA